MKVLHPKIGIGIGIVSFAIALISSMATGATSFSNASLVTQIFGGLVVAVLVYYVFALFIIPLILKLTKKDK